MDWDSLLIIREFVGNDWGRVGHWLGKSWTMVCDGWGIVGELLGHWWGIIREW
jgi:hypothetical protein